MPAIPNKMPEKEKALIKEPAFMELEVEADRELLCEKILSRLGQARSGHDVSQIAG